MTTIHTRQIQLTKKYTQDKYSYTNIQYYNCPSINTTIILKMTMLVIFKIIVVFIDGQV